MTRAAASRHKYLILIPLNGVEIETAIGMPFWPTDDDPRELEARSQIPKKLSNSAFVCAERP